MKKVVLETYLFLLTEDPIMDELSAEEKKAKDKFVNLYKKHQENLVNGKVDKELEMKVKKASEEFNDAKKYSKHYTQTKIDARKSGFSSGGFSKADEEIRRKAEQRARERMGGFRFNWNSDEFNSNFRKHQKEYEERMRKINRRTNIIVWSVVAAYILANVYVAYQDEKKRKEAYLKKKGLNQSESERLATISALQTQITRLKSKLHECDKSDNPQKCKEKIEVRIRKLENRLKKLSKKG